MLSKPKWAFWLAFLVGVCLLFCLHPPACMLSASAAIHTLHPHLKTGCTHPLPPACLQHAVSVKYATEHRCGVVVRGPGLSDQIGGTDPLKDNLPLEVGGCRWAGWTGWAGLGWAGCWQALQAV